MRIFSTIFLEFFLIFSIKISLRDENLLPSLYQTITEEFVTYVKHLLSGQNATFDFQKVADSKIFNIEVNLAKILLLEALKSDVDVKILADVAQQSLSHSLINNIITNNPEEQNFVSILGENLKTDSNEFS